MPFDELKGLLRSAGCTAQRTDASSHFEVVLLDDHLRKAQQQLGDFFGSPVWPSENGLPKHIQKQIHAFGGIRQGQTLYYRNLNGEALFAMLWPWSDGVHTTLKVIKTHSMQ